MTSTQGTDLPKPESPESAGPPLNPSGPPSEFASFFADVSSSTNRAVGIYMKPAFSHDLTLFQKAGDIADGLELGICYSICNVMFAFKPQLFDYIPLTKDVDLPEGYVSGSLWPFKRTDGSLVYSDGGYIPKSTPDEILLAMNASKTNPVVAKSWLVDLAACFQVKKLSRQNVANYFAMNKIGKLAGTSVVGYVDYLSGFLPVIMNDKEVRSKIFDSTFLKYHTTFASTPGLVNRMIEGLGEHAKKILPESAILAAKEAYNAQHDEAKCLAIPMQTIAITDAYLSAIGMRPEIWYQGTKAKSLVPGPMYAYWKKLFAKYFELSYDIDNLEKVKEVDNLFSKYKTTPEVKEVSEVKALTETPEHGEAIKDSEEPEGGETSQTSKEEISTEVTEHDKTQTDIVSESPSKEISPAEDPVDPDLKASKNVKDPSKKKDKFPLFGFERK